MKFKQLEAFVAVVDYGSFSEAARRLYLTQPTISAHIRSLEDELHMKLIIRTTKKTTITAKGYQLYDSAVRMLEIRNNLLENFTGAHKHMIDLAASTIPSSYLLPELLAAFGKTHPDVYFHSIQSDSSESISRVLDGTVDLALVGQNTRDESWAPFAAMEKRTDLYAEGDFDGIDKLEKELLAQNAEHKDWACTEELMKTTKNGKALYLHCLPADITGVSCEAGEVDASVFDRYRIPLYKEASFKPYIIAAMIMLSKFEKPQDILKKLEVKAAPRIMK